MAVEEWMKPSCKDCEGMQSCKLHTLFTESCEDFEPSYPYRVVVSTLIQGGNVSEFEGKQLLRIEPEGESDPVTAPVHYAGDGETTCKDALASMMAEARVAPKVAYWWGSAFKYIWRWPLKNGKQDIDKAIECLKQLKEVL